MRFMKSKVAAVALTAAIIAPTAAQAASFSWSWRLSGNTVTYSTLNSSGGSTSVEDLATWCTWGQSRHSGSFSFSGTVEKRQECTWGVNDVTVTLN